MNKRIGPYEVRGELGAGAMGVVYEVWHPELGASYALKVLRGELCDAADIVRFQRELESMAAVSNHPNVVRIHTAGSDSGQLYYVMDLIRGQNLHQRLTRGPVESTVAAGWVCDIARAVAALHTHGIIHRDIKPENIILGEDGVPRLTDFGLARVFSDERSRLTMTGDLVGTPAFMAPEQALGETGLTPSVDVYALGSVLYTLIAGRPPVGGRSQMVVLSKVASGELVPLSNAAPGAPAELAVLCERTFARDPAERPTAAALAQELDAFLTRGSAGPTAGESASAQRVKLAIAALLVCAALLGVAGFGAVVVRSREALPSAAALGPRADAELAEAQRLLATDAGTGDLLARVRALRVELDAVAGDESLRAARVLAWTTEAECAARAGEVDAARELVAGLTDLPSPRGREARDVARARAVAARAALVSRERDVEKAARVCSDLERAVPLLATERPDLRVLHVRLALLAGRPQEARKALASAAGAPALLRSEVLVANGEFARAEALLEELAPADRARLHLHLGRHAINDDADVARGHFDQALELPEDDPLRLEVAAEMAEKARSSVALMLRAPSLEAESQLLVEVALTWVVAGQLGVGPTEKELQTVENYYFKLGAALPLGRQYLVLQLAPTRPSFVLGYTYRVLRKQMPDPERDLPVFRGAVEKADSWADPEKTAMIFEQYAHALQQAQRPDEILALTERVRKRYADRPYTLAYVEAQCGRVLAAAGRDEEGLAHLDAAVSHLSDLMIARYARFMLRAKGVAAGSPAPPEVLADGWVILGLPREGEGTPSSVHLRQVIVRLVEMELAAGRPARAIEALDSFLATELVSQFAARRIELLLDHGDDPKRLAAAAAFLAPAIEREGAEQATWHARYGGDKPLDSARFERLAAEATKFPGLVEAGDLEGLRERLRVLRPQLP